MARFFRTNKVYVWFQGCLVLMFLCLLVFSAEAQDERLYHLLERYRQSHQDKNLTVLMSCFDKRAQIVSLTTTSEYQTVTLDQFMARHEEIFQKYAQIKENFRNMTVEVYEERMAMISVEYTYQMDHIQQHGKDYFICLRDLQGQWRIVSLSYMLREQTEG